tara:strand:- start:130 stop:432 length:303 start_codon:yes stop_codon:yes gene_type:complete
MVENSEIITYNEINKNYKPSNNISVPFLTLYEKTSILGLRKQQLANGAKTYLDNKLIKDIKDIEEIAELELKHKKLPFLVCRTFNDEYKEYIKLDDLIIL